MASVASLSPDIFACRFLSSPVAFINGLGGVFFSSFVVDSSLLFAVLHYLLSIIAGRGSLSAVFDCPLSIVVGGNLLFAVFDCLLPFVASDGPLSTISDCLLSFIPSGSYLAIIFGHSSLSFMPLTCS